MSITEYYAAYRKGGRSALVGHDLEYLLVSLGHRLAADARQVVDRTVHIVADDALGLCHAFAVHSKHRRQNGGVYARRNLHRA